MSLEVVDLAQALARIDEPWHPHIAGRLNGQEVRLAKLEGAFVWHAHAEADELFLVIEGRLELQLRGRTLVVDPGQFVIVPRGVEHRPVAPEGCQVLLFEPAGVVNTGDAPEGELTREVLPEV